MKPILFFLLISAFSIPVAKAQADYYSGKTTVSGNGFVYKLDHTIPIRIGLKNSNNTRTGVRPLRSDGSVIPFEQDPIAKRRDPEELRQIAKEVFSSVTIGNAKTQDAIILIECVIDLAGNTQEVAFGLDNVSSLRNIPPEQYYELEQKIKERIKWNIEDRFKNVNYITMTLLLKFRLL